MMKLAPKISRILLGLVFFVFGGAGLLNLFPPPPDMPEALQTFMNGIMSTGYFFPVLKGTETLCGLMLLANVAPAIALVILAPITVQILLLHGFLTPGIQNLVVPLLVLVLHLIAAKGYWSVYQPLFKAKS